MMIAETPIRALPDQEKRQKMEPIECIDLYNSTLKKVEKVRSFEEAVALSNFESRVQKTLFSLVIGNESNSIEERVDILRNFAYAIAKMNKLVFEDENFLNVLELALVRKEYR